MRRREFSAIAWKSFAGACLVNVGRRSAAADDSANKIKIGQIGTGHSHAAGKLEAVRKLSDVFDLVGVVESDEQLRNRAAKSSTYAGVTWLGVDELLGTPGLQAVVIETRMTDSAAAAARALAAGKHMHLDKPGALRHDDFRKLRLDAESRGLTVQMGYMLRYNPAFSLMFQAAREGWFGDILEIDCSMGKLADDGLRRSLAEVPGNGMFELACHLIDAVVTLLGKPTRVTAIGVKSRSPDDVLTDNQLAVFEYPKATATIRCNHADPFGGPHRRFQLVGSHGGIEIAPLESGQIRLWLSEPRGEYRKGEQTAALKMPAGRYDLEFVDLAEVLRRRKPLAWNAAHDIAVHESVLRAADAWDES